MTASRNRNNDIPRNYEEILEDFLAEKEEIKEKLLREVMRFLQRTVKKHISLRKICRQISFFQS